jgi:hypothetical protein
MPVPIWQRSALHRAAAAGEIVGSPRAGASMVQQAASLPWWINPTWAVLLVVLPILLLTLWQGPAGLTYFKNYVNNYNWYTSLAAIASLLALGCGTLVRGVFGGGPANPASLIDLGRLKLALWWLGLIALCAYAILLGPWILNPQIVAQALQGMGEEETKQAMARLPGLTSFTNVAPLFCAVWSAARLDPRFRPGMGLWCVFAALVVFTLARTLVGEERLALVEFVTPLVLAHAAFHARPSLLRAVFPALGLIALVIYFAAAEYFRSWQYYRLTVSTQFWEFSVLRLVGYYSTSLNNGMGMFQLYSPIGLPYFTAGAFTKLPFWSFLFGTGGNISDDIWGVYLFEFASPEFNNLSGLFVPLIDFGLLLGLSLMAAIGIAVGLLYRSYARRRIAGLLLYPTCYLGVLEIVRLFYFGESRVFPIFLAAGFVGWFLARRSGARRPILRGGRPAASSAEAAPIGDPA